MGDARDGEVEGAGRCGSTARWRRRISANRPTANCLCDGVRVLNRLMVKVRKELGEEAFPFHNHRRAAKRWALRASRRRGRQRVAAYRELLGTTRRTLRYLQGALEAAHGCEGLRGWREEALHCRQLVERVIDQTERRVLRGEKVPVREKVASLFEPHTDIIVKGGRQVQYGHKLNLSTGASGLVLDAVVEKGNPADSSRCIAMIERHARIYGSVPGQVACDAGYASKRNLEEAKAMGVTDVMFHKKKGLQPGGHDVHPGDLRAAPPVPGRNRGGNLVSQTVLRPPTVRLAGPRSLPSLRLVGDRRPQPGGAGPQRAETQADVRPYRDRGGSLKTGSGEPGAPQPPTGPPSPSGITLDRKNGAQAAREACDPMAKASQDWRLRRENGRDLARRCRRTDPCCCIKAVIMERAQERPDRSPRRQFWSVPTSSRSRPCPARSRRSADRTGCRPPDRGADGGRPFRTGQPLGGGGHGSSMQSHVLSPWRAASPTRQMFAT